MGSTRKVSLTDTERNHLLSLLEWNERDGIYYGNKDYYWRRHQKLIEKLGDQKTKENS